MKDRQVKCEINVWPLGRTPPPHDGREQAPAAVVAHDLGIFVDPGVLGKSIPAQWGCQWTIVDVTPLGIAGVVVAPQ